MWPFSLFKKKQHGPPTIAIGGLRATIGQRSEAIEWRARYRIKRIEKSLMRATGERRVSLEREMNELRKVLKKLEAIAAIDNE